MASLDSLRSNNRLRGAMQVVLICVLALGAWQIADLRSEANRESSKVATAEAIIAQTCGGVSFEELRMRGLVEECRLAQAGKLTDAIPDDAAKPDEAPSDVNPDVVDDGDTDRDDIRVAPMPQGPTDGQVVEAVNDYLRANPLSAGPTYVRTIRRAVSGYLSANPPEDGRPPTEGEIRDAVQASLLANPPANGTDGSDGKGIVSASLDGCDAVFAYTDGSTSRVGPICGPKGEKADPPTATEVSAAVDAYCMANGCTGPAGSPGVVSVVDNCPPAGVGQQITDVNLTPPDEGQAMVLTCEYGGLLGGGN